MTDEDVETNHARWTEAWIEQQRELLRRSADAKATGEAARSLGERWLDAGRTYLSGLQAFAQPGAMSPDSLKVGSFKVGEELLDSWRSAWGGIDASQQSAVRAVSDLLGRLPPLGIAREHTEAWRELAATQAQCQQLEQELRGVLLGVQGEALNLLEERVRERQASARRIAGFRDLYDLWVECAEQVFAKVAHSETYGKLQAELGNATLRLRAHHQKVIEYGLKQLDLPTRSELNSVHLQLRALKQQLAKLGEVPARKKAPAKAARKPRASRR